MYTVDIDTGGTMTDALVSGGEELHAFKVDTTPHDYTVSFVGCLAEASRKLGFADIEGFLSKVDLIRWSSTITTNVLGERRGSKVGLLVARGAEQTLYGASRSVVICARARDLEVDVTDLVGHVCLLQLPRGPTDAGDRRDRVGAAGDQVQGGGPGWPDPRPTGRHTRPAGRRHGPGLAAGGGRDR